jgi:hypothetical protein
LNSAAVSACQKNQTATGVAPSGHTGLREYINRKQGDTMVTRTIGILALALVTPLAFAQISATSTEQIAACEVVTTYESGKVIVVASGTGPDTFSCVLNKSILYVNKAGEKVDEHLIKPGTRIRICFDAKGQSRVIKRVVVDEESLDHD